MGLVVPSIGLDASFAAAPALRGGIAFVSQSGALTSAALDWAVSRNIGFSCVVSLGEAVDVDAADIIDYREAIRQRARCCFISNRCRTGASSCRRHARLRAASR
ncbi:MAG: hypothetical protein M5U30_09850 [Burkholderiaceae bacterium]|nr:hypothetical protein [Burkholderiaceae bacterium]